MKDTRNSVVINDTFPTNSILQGDKVKGIVTK